MFHVNHFFTTQSILFNAGIPLGCAFSSSKERGASWMIRNTKMQTQIWPVPKSSCTFKDTDSENRATCL